MELIVPNWKACGDFGCDIGISTAPLGIVSHFILTSLVVLMLTAAQPSDEGLATQHEGINNGCLGSFPAWDRFPSTMKLIVTTMALARLSEYIVFDPTHPHL